MTQAEPLLCDVNETATLLGVSETTVWVLIRSGQLASVKVPGSTGRGKRSMRKVERAEISAFIKRNRVTATA